MRIFILFLALPCLSLTACIEQTLQQHVGALTPNLSALNPTSKEMHGVVMTVKGCSISTSRIATCSFTVTSKYQDRTLNLIGGLNTKIQDDTGVSYNTLIAFGKDPTDKTQRSTTLIADTPYEFTMMAQNISTRATKIRAITISRMDVTGTGSIGYLKLNFAHPPMISTNNNVVVRPNNKQTTTVDTAQTIEPVTSGHMPYRHLFATIKPINEHVEVDAGIKALWGKGAYLHLNPNGTLGHNWSKPGPYAYAPGQKWKMDGNSLIIIFDPKVSYTFDVSKPASSMITYLDQGGIFEMTAYLKGKNQR